jgi:hypothetical protein
VNFDAEEAVELNTVLTTRFVVYRL